MSDVIGILPRWKCPTCGQMNNEWVDKCGRCGEIETEKMNKVFDKEVERITKRQREEHPELWGDVDPLQNIKESNPKDSIGVKKASMSYVPAPVLMEAALGMMEGGFKYRRHNYRVIGVRASVYYDATIRHLMAYWEGEDIDPDSGLSHLTKAICSLIVWRDAEMQGKYADDRPPKHANKNWVKDMNKQVENLMQRYPEQKPPYTEVEEAKK